MEALGETFAALSNIYACRHPHTFRHGCHRPDSLRRSEGRVSKARPEELSRSRRGRPVRVLSAGDFLITVTDSSGHRPHAFVRSIFVSRCISFEILTLVPWVYHRAKLMAVVLGGAITS